MTLKGILIVVYLDLLMPLAVFLNVYLYFYPVFHFCSFHSPPDGTSAAPFRLLALGDPQLEGDTTLRRYASQHKPGDPLLSYLDPSHLSRDFHRYRKIIDLWGNDLYLSHIYKTMRRQLDPTHTVVLGDLIGSQWIGNEEFQRRGDRFWEVFSGGNKVNTSDIEARSADGEHWKYKVITLPGNHDIGYAGDMTRGRVDRFVDMFGPINYDLTVTPPHASGDDAPSLKLVVLNSMTLDEPILDPTLREDSYALINRLESSTTGNPNPKEATVLLTHLPFYKQSGVCVDAPFFTYFPAGQGGGIKEQNHLSAETSSHVLTSFFGTPMDGKQAGVILTGHDHEGCDVRHVRLGEGWNATRWEHLATGVEKKKLQETEAAKGGVREVTVQSMMGGYGGNAGLVSAWWDEKAQSWRFEYSTCALGTQYVWWGVHVVDIICAVAGFLLYSAHQRDAAKNLRKAAAVQEMLDAQKKSE